MTLNWMIGITLAASMVDVSLAAQPPNSGGQATLASSSAIRPTTSDRTVVGGARQIGPTAKTVGEGDKAKSTKSFKSSVLLSDSLQLNDDVGIPPAQAGEGGHEIIVADGTTRPESFTATPHGDLIVGSSSSPIIHLVRIGPKSTDTFVNLETEGGLFLGMLADASTGMLWACLLTPTAEGLRSNLRGFDLETGVQRVKWDLPGSSTCNDMSVGPDTALYVTDTAGKMYRLPAGADEAELLLDGDLLRGVDGITFLEGVLYVNNISSGKFYRIPMDGGKAGPPVELVLQHPINKPDGMRAANGMLFVAESGAGRVLSLKLDGDAAKIAVVMEGLEQPTAVEPIGDVLWFNELPTGVMTRIPLPR